MGGRPAVPGVQTWDPRHGLGGQYTKKKMFRPQVQMHTQRPQYAKKFCPPTKGGTRKGVKIEKFIGGSFRPEMMILQGVRMSETISWGMLREQPQKGGGIRRLRVRLI